ncbi:uncharacterized protein TNCT_160151 [Trichonephila clavata]|uniref:Uncharacterized protein n=1 Tax=Trichonephila clavata TaxID=2740835 RepID=A0A8X6FTC5_TRICU|nr:uncharacterized protein TNCT_160151 [Trichonephila clavata]
MSSDSEISGPSPLPSPIFARCSPARGTVARKCREFYLKRLERTASMQKRWSICDVPQESMQEFGTPFEQKHADGEHSSSSGTETANEPKDKELSVSKTCGDNFEGYPLRKCRSSFDIAMDSLRKEISMASKEGEGLGRLETIEMGNAKPVFDGSRAFNRML